MDEGLPPKIPFLPDLIVRHDEGMLITGMEGELVWLDHDLNPTGEVSLPHPMRLRQAVIHDGQLFGTWLDRELLLAYMASIPVGSSSTGPSRAELRTSINTPVTHHPAGNRWSHALDAEPMALAVAEDAVIFVLYRRGLYSITSDAEENWRLPPPTWNYAKKRPRNEETIAVHIADSEILLASRGGRVQRRALDSGLITEEYILPNVDGPVERFFHSGEHQLVSTTDGMVVWYHRQNPVQKLMLSGPVQGASWDEKAKAWRIAGWREEVILSAERCERAATHEIPVHIESVDGGAFILFNDGTWANSAFETHRLPEEEA